MKCACFNNNLNARWNIKRCGRQVWEQVLSGILIWVKRIVKEFLNKMVFAFQLFEKLDLVYSLLSFHLKDLIWWNRCLVIDANMIPGGGILYLLVEIRKKHTIFHPLRVSFMSKKHWSRVWNGFAVFKFFNKRWRYGLSSNEFHKTSGSRKKIFINVLGKITKSMFYGSF